MVNLPRYWPSPPKIDAPAIAEHTDAEPWVTVIVIDADFPSIVAVTEASPGAMAVMATESPEVTPLTTDRLFVVHEVARPVRAFPEASRGVATSSLTSPATISRAVKFSETDATAALVTTTVAVPVRPPDAAVMVTVPGASADTVPICETLATTGFDENQETDWFTSMFCPASRTVANSGELCPGAIVTVDGVIETDAGAVATTFTLNEPDLPSLVAVMTALPAAIAVTRPVVLTLAVDGLLEFHVITRPASALASAARVTATICVVDPMVSVGCGVETDTDATGASTIVRVAVPDTPSLVAVNVAIPGAIPDTTPVPDTVATLALLDVHVTTRSVTMPPEASLVMADSCIVEPAFNVGAGADTTTDAMAPAETATEIEPTIPSLDAITFATPGAMPTTRPEDDTEAIAGLLDDQSTMRSLTTIPAVVRTVAVSCTVPFSTIVDVGAVTVIAPTGTGATVIARLPTFPSAVVRTVAVPAASAVTSPDAETLAMAGFEVVQTRGRSVTISPAAVFTVGVACVDPPTINDVVAAVSVIDAIGTGWIVRLALPVIPSTDAEIETVPGASALTAPDAATDAIAALLDVQVSVRFNTFPAPSRTIAVA